MKRSFLIATIGAALFSSAPMVANAESAHGLAERRAAASYTQTIWPDQNKAIQVAAGFPVAVKLDMDTLALPGLSESYAADDYLGKTVIQPLIAALQNITMDDMGKQALQAKLETIHIFYDVATAPASNYSDGIKFENGTLSINWQPYSNVDDVEPRIEALTKLLEANL